MKIVIVGLSVTSSWGNGHATTYRSLIRGLKARGHEVLFLERDLPWYAGNRDSPNPPGATTCLYNSVDELFLKFQEQVTGADLVIVGSFVPDGIAIGGWVTERAKGVTAFYDIDTPITLDTLKKGSPEYISPDLIGRYNLYLSFTGGPILHQIERLYGARIVRPLYCSVDTDRYFPVSEPPDYDLGYLGTYSGDRQPSLDALMLEPARRWPAGRFIVAGPMYPESIRWPENVERVIHLSPREHPAFYGSQRFTLNITRDAMKRAGYSPSVRLFEAASCGVPIISDNWEGLDTIFDPGRDILLAANADETLRILHSTTERDRLSLARHARARIVAEHTSEMRATQLEGYVDEALALARNPKAVYA